MKLVIPILLPIGEEEGFVFAVVEFRNPHGSADVESVIMPARPVAKVIGSIVGVEDIIDGVIVRRAVILVVPDFMIWLNSPPETEPYSALKLLVLIAISWTASGLTSLRVVIVVLAHW